MNIVEENMPGEQIKTQEITLHYRDPTTEHLDFPENIDTEPDRPKKLGKNKSYIRLKNKPIQATSITVNAALGNRFQKMEEPSARDLHDSSLGNSSSNEPSKLYAINTIRAKTSLVSKFKDTQTKASKFLLPQHMIIGNWNSNMFIDFER